MTDGYISGKRRPSYSYSQQGIILINGLDASLGFGVASATLQGFGVASTTTLF